MKRIFVGIFIILVSNVWADDPCAILGKGSYSSSNNKCIKDNGFGQTPTEVLMYEQELLARIINNQAAQSTEIAGLRADLKTAISQLSSAVDALAKVSVALVNNNDKWQKETLNQTIGAINAMPGNLANEKALQAVLLATIKEQLIKDPAFLDAVKKSP